MPTAVGVCTLVPLAATLPVHAPLAVQDDPALELQVTVALWPSTMLAGATEIVSVGGGVLLPPP